MMERKFDEAAWKSEFKERLRLLFISDMNGFLNQQADEVFEYEISFRDRPASPAECAENRYARLS